MAKNIEFFAMLQSADPMSVVAVKLGPVATPSGPSYGYVHTRHYQELAAAFGMSPHQGGGYDSGLAYNFPSGPVLLAHESGPEILLLVKDAAEIVELFLTLAGAVSLIAGVAGWLGKKVKATPHPPRRGPLYKPARFMRIETYRLGPGREVRERLVQIVDLGREPDESAIRASVAEAAGSGSPVE